ncbi:selenocysteine lyase [Candidatus Endobugula sertula]|uniref:Selenocysteine lyase n=1 Tax=Candidatus Endobugula sertula TaxID=62101 RepID=A0A1D2QTB0_9GAMM|nr:selenocysteine lyase [Candidatus Endobugula sertula]
MSLENYFNSFRKNVIGIDKLHPFKAGMLPIIYADWAASGRLYEPIEEYISHTLGPYVANTHTETSLTGCTMTHLYKEARDIIKQHVGAGDGDVLLFEGFGMTGAVNKFQRLMGLRTVKATTKNLTTSHEKPLIIITHMEHHSNQTSWIECDVDVEIIEPGIDGRPSLDHLEHILQSNSSRPLLMASVSACSNVTGISTNYYKIAELMHRYGGYVCVDFSGSAPYVKIDMHPENPEESLDVIFFSPHKFLGGPGSSGVLAFNKKLYQHNVPDNPGGGTVKWTNPWGEHRYYEDIETREDGGTPGFLQATKASLAILLKERMGVDKIIAREKELVCRLLDGIKHQQQIEILESHQMQRLGFISFYAKDVHYNLFVKLLNDYFGIQSRGGCSCAGTYGHILLNVDKNQSKSITDKIDLGNLADKPGWVRISLHPVMSDQEIDRIVEGINAVVEHHQTWAKDYQFNSCTGEFEPLSNVDQYIDIKHSFNVIK